LIEVLFGFADVAMHFVKQTECDPWSGVERIECGGAAEIGHSGLRRYLGVLDVVLRVSGCNLDGPGERSGIAFGREMVGQSEAQGGEEGEREGENGK